MPTMPPTYRPPGQPTRQQQQRETDQRRGNANERLYGYAWHKASRQFLKLNPLCKYCAQNGRHKPANTVDHIIPHHGDLTLFWDSETNWQSLCATCHSSTKKREELAAKK